MRIPAESIPLEPIGESANATTTRTFDTPEDVATRSVSRAAGGVLGTLRGLARPVSTTMSFGLAGSTTSAPPTGPRAPVDVTARRKPLTGSHDFGLFGIAKHSLARFTGASGAAPAADQNCERLQTSDGARALVAARFGVDAAATPSDSVVHEMLDTLHATLGDPKSFALTGYALASVCNGDAGRAAAALRALRDPQAASAPASRDAFAIERALAKSGDGCGIVLGLRGLPPVADPQQRQVREKALITQMACADKLLRDWPADAGDPPRTVDELTRMIDAALSADPRDASTGRARGASPALREMSGSIAGRALIAAALLLDKPGAALPKHLRTAYLPAANGIFDDAQVRDFSNEMFGLLRNALAAADAGSLLGLGTVVDGSPLTSLVRGTGGQMLREPKADFAEFQQATVRSIATLVADFDPNADPSTHSPQTMRNMVRAFAIAHWCQRVGTDGWTDTCKFSREDLADIEREAKSALGLDDCSSGRAALSAQVRALTSVNRETLGEWLRDAGTDVSPGTEQGDRLSALRRFERQGNTFAGGQLDGLKLTGAVAEVAAHLRAQMANPLENELRACALETWAELSTRAAPDGTAQGWSNGMPLPQSARESMAGRVAAALGTPSRDDVMRSPEFAQIGSMGIDTLLAWAAHAGISDGPLHARLTDLASNRTPDADDFVDALRAAIAGARTTYPVILQRTERLGVNMNVPLSLKQAIEKIKPAVPAVPGETAPMSLLMGPDVALAGSRISSVVAGSTALSGCLDVTRGYGVGGHAGWATIATANIGAPKVIHAQGIATGQLWLNGDAAVSQGWTMRSRMVPGQPEAWREQLLAAYDAMFGTRGDRPTSPEDLFERLCEQHATNPAISISPMEVTRYSGGPSFNVTVGVRGDFKNWKPGGSLGIGAAASYTATRRADRDAGAIRTSITNNTLAASTSFSAAATVGVPTVSLDKGPVSTLAFPSIPIVGASVVTMPLARGGTARISIEDGRIAPTSVWDDESVRVKDLTARTERPERRQSWIDSLGGGEVGRAKLDAFLNHCDAEADKGNLLIADRQIIRPEAAEKINTLLALREIHAARATPTAADRAAYDEYSRAISSILQSDNSWKNRFLYLLENTVNRRVIGPDTMLTAQTIDEVLTPHQLHAQAAEN